MTATRFWSAVFARKEPSTPYVFRMTKGPIMQYVWIWLESFSKTDSTSFPVDKIAVLIVLQALFYKQFTAVVFLLIFKLKIS